MFTQEHCMTIQVWKHGIKAPLNPSRIDHETWTQEPMIEIYNQHFAEFLFHLPTKPNIN